jgi:hypothetical protein
MSRTPAKVKTQLTGRLCDASSFIVQFLLH